MVWPASYGLSPSDVLCDATAGLQAQAPPTDPSWITDGTLLDQLAQRHIKTCTDPDKTYNMPEEITLGSFCSGSEGFHTACVAIEKALAAKWTVGHINGKASPKIKQVWMSEVNAQKREWEMLVNTDPDCCSFGDVRGLGTFLISWPSQWSSG